MYHLGGHRGDGQAHGRGVDTLPVRQLSADVNPAVNVVLPAVHNRHAQLAVVEEERITLCIL